jgi:hypothetical protein
MAHPLSETGRTWNRYATEDGVPRRGAADQREGTVTRTAELLRENGFAVDEELWAMDAADCSPCDNKVPDSH